MENSIKKIFIQLEYQFKNEIFYEEACIEEVCYHVDDEFETSVTHFKNIFTDLLKEIKEFKSYQVDTKTLIPITFSNNFPLGAGCNNQYGEKTAFQLYKNQTAINIIEDLITDCTEIIDIKLYTAELIEEIV